MGLAEDIQSLYPDLAFLFSDPEVGPILQQAVTPFQEWSEGRFLGAIRNTQWYRERSESGRRVSVLQATDPGTLRDMTWNYQANLREVANGLGAKLTDPELTLLTAIGLNGGYEANSAFMRQALVPMIKNEDIATGVGAAGVASREIANIIRGNWFVMSDNLQDLGHNLALSRNVTAGYDSLESINARYAVWAMGAYPHLREQIQAGQTLADIFNPYRQIVADELELGHANNVDMGSPMWNQMLNWRDATTGEVRLPTASEVTRIARDQPKWWTTTRGRAADAQATDNILKAFGKVK